MENLGDWIRSFVRSDGFLEAVYWAGSLKLNYLVLLFFTVWTLVKMWRFERKLGKNPKLTGYYPTMGWILLYSLNGFLFQRFSYVLGQALFILLFGIAIVSGVVSIKRDAHRKGAFKLGAGVAHLLVMWVQAMTLDENVRMMVGFAVLPFAVAVIVDMVSKFEYLDEVVEVLGEE